MEKAENCLELYYRIPNRLRNWDFQVLLDVGEKNKENWQVCLGRSQTLRLICPLSSAGTLSLLSPDKRLEVYSLGKVKQVSGLEDTQIIK